MVIIRVIEADSIMLLPKILKIATLLSFFFAGTSFLETMFPHKDNPNGVRWKTLSELPDYSGSCARNNRSAIALFIEDYTANDVPVTLKASGRISEVLYIYPLTTKIKHINETTSTVRLSGLKKKTPSYVVLCSRTPSMTVVRLTANNKNYDENSNAISFAGRTEGKVRVWAKRLFWPFLIIAGLLLFIDLKYEKNSSKKV